MRSSASVALLLVTLALAVLCVDAPATAAPEIAAIEATAPLSDPSEESVQAAIVTAVQKAARGALAMGLPWVRVEGAYVRPGYVGVHVLAMKEPLEVDGQPDADATPAPTPERPRIDDNDSIRL